MERLPRPHECGPLAREFFAAAFEAAVAAAATTQAPGAPPEDTSRVEIADDQGVVTQYVLPESPLSRMIDAMNACCADDEAVSHNVVFRVYALLRMLRRPALRPWVQVPPEDAHVTIPHPAVVFAAAEVPLTKKGVFPTAVFVKKVGEIVATAFPEHAL